MYRLIYFIHIQVHRYSLQLMSNGLIYLGKEFIFYCRNDENGEINDFFSFDWEKEFSTERRLKLVNGKEAHFIVGI
jgi:hypothetical protein